jgi:hypothetical protein
MKMDKKSARRILRFWYLYVFLGKTKFLYKRWFCALVFDYIAIIGNLRIEIKFRMRVLAATVAIIFSLVFVYNLMYYTKIKCRSTQMEFSKPSGKEIENKMPFNYDPKSFCVIACIFNPVSFESRYKSYMLFEQHILSFGVYLMTIELVVGNQTFQVTDANNSRHLQFKTNDILWYKENLINIGIKRSPAHCNYIAWIDLEVRFLNMNWVRDTMNALEQFKVVQLFEIVKILGPESQTIEAHMAYGQCFSKNRTGLYSGKLKKKFKIPIKGYCAPGYAWAAKKATLLEIDGLFDKGILGDGKFMLTSLVS